MCQKKQKTKTLSLEVKAKDTRPLLMQQTAASLMMEESEDREEVRRIMTFQNILPHQHQQM